MAPAMQHEADGPGVVESLLPVSRETVARLEAFVALVRKWQPAENLIAPSTLPSIWRRHVADCAQLVALFPDVYRWLDLGSGAGFPGMVLGCLLAEKEGAAVHLVESNSRKCAFLRAAVRETGAPVVVHQGRIEAVVDGWRDPVDMITARALAPLGRLLALAAPLLPETPAAFFKGADFVREIDETTQSWDLDLVKHTSRIDEHGVILEIRRATPRDSTRPVGQRP